MCNGPSTYQFFLYDGHGSEFTVTPRIPPAVASLECQQIYPDYTKTSSASAPAHRSLPFGGSHLKIHVNFDQSSQQRHGYTSGSAEKNRATVDDSHLNFDADIPIPAKDLTGISVHLVDDLKRQLHQ